jgi:hypothetical protein
MWSFGPSALLRAAPLAPATLTGVQRACAAARLPGQAAAAVISRSRAPSEMQLGRVWGKGVPQRGMVSGSNPRAACTLTLLTPLLSAPLECILGEGNRSTAKLCRGRAVPRR